MTGTAIVMGAGDALGGAIARRFAREGLVAVPSRRKIKPLGEPVSQEACSYTTSTLPTIYPTQISGATTAITKQHADDNTHSTARQHIQTLNAHARAHFVQQRTKKIQEQTHTQQIQTYTTNAGSSKSNSLG